VRASKRTKKAILLGLGLDNEDGHLRVTRGENFQLLGGSHDTHQSMQEKCIKFNERLKDRGKRLEDLPPNELHELADQCQMNMPRPGGKPQD
jgi:hypothetical protein